MIPHMTAQASRAACPELGKRISQASVRKHAASGKRSYGTEGKEVTDNAQAAGELHERRV